MPRGDKSDYTDKQKRKAEHIEEGYEDRGVSEKEAERRAWATVNKEAAAATNPVPAAARRIRMNPPKRAAASAVRHPPHARRRNVPLPRRRPRRRASVTNTTATID